MVVATNLMSCNSPVIRHYTSPHQGQGRGVSATSSGGDGDLRRLLVGGRLGVRLWFVRLGEIILSYKDGVSHLRQHQAHMRAHSARLLLCAALRPPSEKAGNSNMGE